MVKLRLKRKGRIHHPVYDIIAIDERSRRDGAFIERLGYYDPNHQPSVVKVDPDRTIYWLSVGAQPTNLVRNLLSYEGVLLRKYMASKGKNQVEIEEAVQLHKEVARAKYFRRKELRIKRNDAKEKAAAAAKEEAAKPAPVPEVKAEETKPETVPEVKTESAVTTE
ncbi:MAG: 30S ribosomal protein S16 [Ignavibacteria bacterium GWB2_35_12]|nr:MAG: 30S ribosomal protein S16 [Ignavibacteria bacterium GWA2_35_8]OGU41865.1 MAG: 30S ribosomal protein S16 [Ignavibacteria bacterium GWB2_35_12]OGU86158.1 MAG: 30S ribosomal protein S16 [Ignavibacteria bacterium RIFOXYA2_FULL_35_10]OGV23487.1 MAG: 30S ribosomal protein S16 [Ignavibacteria bacterium RIFOXYC2_FULL_35_21]